MSKKSNNIIARLITDPAFRSWCLGNVTEREHRHWERWISEHDDCIKDIITAKKIVLELEEAKRGEAIAPHQKYESWSQLNMRLKSPTYQSQKSHHLFGHSSLGWVLTAAATMLLLITTLLTIQYTDFIQLPSSDKTVQLQPELLSTSTDFGERKVIALDSGTRITLNANSVITHYDGWVHEDTVRVELQGEAYFDVTPRERGQGPVFQVRTDEGSVHVLGTRFMVNTWDETTKVVLEEGKVAIRRDHAFDNNDRAILHPSELAVFSRTTSDIIIRDVNTSIYTSWTKGLFEFDRALLPEVADRIEKIFGKEVVIADPFLMAKRVSGAVENDDLDVLLSALSSTLNISIVEYDDQIVFRQHMLEGSFLNQTLNKWDRNE